MEELDNAKKWIEDRIYYIKSGCDLSDADNKTALDSFEIALSCINKVKQTN